jgi:hypothetical protein
MWRGPRARLRGRVFSRAIPYGLVTLPGRYPGKERRQVNYGWESGAELASCELSCRWRDFDIAVASLSNRTR